MDSASPPPATVAGVDFRHWLVRRIDIEARAYRNGDAQTKAIRWGRVLGFLEVGVELGYWTRRTSSRASDAIYYGSGRGVARMLVRSASH